MADKELFFKIGFDLEAGVKEALKDGDKALNRIEEALSKNPVIVKMRLDQQNRLSGQVKSESQKAASALSGLKKEMADLNRQWNSLTASERGGEAGAKLMAQYRALSEEAKGYMTTLNAAVKLEDKLARQREKSANAATKAAQKTREYNDELKNQDGYISRLLKRMVVYAGYSMATNFLTSVRDVTAEFELQRVSLGAIIQDQQRANQLFAEIKSFALTSPLKILDLTKYTKQVAAYGFETEKLFDTTKMLADISVGLGADISRATLFLGQVYATGYLRAAELRQATELGIPLVDKLAKKLEELNGRFYSAADVMDLISKRAISFEMVESVFKDMTSAGGEFYNMQVKQSQTLYGMWSKLGDAAAIMYDQIGNTSTVNAGMKTTMGLLESMMRNWKTTARVLDTVSVALAVYVIGLKNAAVASTAMTTTEAARLAITNRQIITTPKLIAAIIGQNTATKLSTTLTKAHTVAMLNQSTATNVLSRGFWKLTAAMLANPWVAAAAGIALVVTALIHFIGNTETAAERAEKLNNSVASLKNLDDTTKPLIDTYNELINKTERTAEEQKRLSEVTHELAKQYPGAITAIGDFGEEVDLAADKLNKLYQAEKQARMDNTRFELEQTEKKIKEVEAEIEKYQQQLASGEKTIYKRLGDSGLRTKKVVPLTEEDKGNILKRINELRYGEDGQSGLFGLQQSAEAARRALGLIPSEAVQAVEKFGAWKKTLTTFSQQVGNIRVQLFDDSTIAQFGTLEEALKKTAEEYKKNIALVATYDETLKSASLTSEERAKIETERAEADAMANLAEKALKYYNAMSLLNTSTSGRGTKSDNRLQNLQEIERTLTSINKKYEELAKTEGNTAALEYVRKNYDSTLKYINKLGKQFNLNFAMPTDFKDLQSYRKAIQGVIEQLKMKGYEKAAIELELKIAEGNQAQLQKEIQAKLKALADRISRTKTAKEFYEKILNATGDYDLAANVTLSIHGESGESLKELLKEQFKRAFRPLHDINYDEWLNTWELIENSNYERLSKYIKLLPEEQRKAAEDLVKAQQQMSEKQFEQWVKDLEVAKTFADKRVQLSRDTANRIAEINASNRPDDVKKKMVAGYEKRENKEAAKLEWEAFKDMPMYVQLFSDLDTASSTMLRNMRDELERVKGAWKDLSPTELKEIERSITELNRQLVERNPGKAFSDLRERRSTLVATYGEESVVMEKLIAEMQNLRNARAELDKANRAEAESLARYNMFLESKGARAIETTSSKMMLDVNRGITKEKSRQADKAEELVKTLQKALSLYLELTSEEENAGKAINRWIGFSREAVSQSRAAVEAWSALGEDEMWGSIFNNFDRLLSVAENAVTAFTSTNPLEQAQAAVSAIMGLISLVGDLVYSSKVARANKEIKKQQELLDQLEYTYGRLEKAADKAFGADYVANITRQVNLLKAEAEAKLKQAEAERSKGKKEDEEKTKQYIEEHRDILDQIADMEGKVSERMFGMDLTSAARDFATAWLDAYKEFGNTADAMSEKFHEMIEDMIAESLLAKVMEQALKPAFEMIEDMETADFYNESFWQQLMITAEQGANNANHGAEVVMSWLEKMGMNTRGMGGEFSGIAKNIAGATSEEINNVAGIGNTLMYYVSPIPRMDENLAVIRQLMERGTTSILPDTTAAGWTDWERQAMDNYIAIQRNTADTVVECRRAANACEASVEKLGRIITSKGSVSGVNVFMKG